MEYPNLSGDDFKRIINLFKWIGIAVISGISLLVSVAVIISYKDVNAMREDLRLRAESMNNEVKELRVYSQNEIKNLQEHSLGQIRLIREEAANMAKASAEAKIQQILSDNETIRRMIEETAKNKLYASLDDILQSELERSEKQIQHKIAMGAQLASSEYHITQGSRQALLFVDSLRKKSSDNFIKASANNLWKQKQLDYSRFYNYNLFEEELKKMFTFPSNTVPLGPQGFLGNFLLIEKEIPLWRDFENNKNHFKNICIGHIRNHKDLNIVATSFRLLEYLTDYHDFELFDFEEFENTLQKLNLE